ncbi:MAG: GerW family sporulation protein [Clostridia bacterium]
MKEHPIEALMEIAMQNIQDMVDVNTIIGAPIEINSNVTIIPISKVSFGFVAGGSEFKGETIEEYNRKDKDEEITYKNPFGGGSGAGVNISPVSFLVINNDNIKLMPVEYCSTVDKIVDYIPDILNKANDFINSYKKEKKQNKENMKQTISYTYDEEDV